MRHFSVVFLAVFLVAAFAADLFVLFGLFLEKHEASETTAVAPKEQSKTLDAIVTSAAARPVRLTIPSIGVDTNIEHVGTRPNGEMDVPKKWAHVGWFKEGYKPGAQGSAVIAGHYDTNFGLPAAFYRLGRLKTGDEVVVEMSDGNRMTFTVTASALYDTRSREESVFGPDDKPRLNLITCNGVWNEVTRDYSKRLVVFTELQS